MFKIFPLLIFLFALSLSWAQSMKAQSLKSSQYKVCGKTLNLEEAKNPQERSIGMMHRAGVEEGRGMIFIFDFAEDLSFWMRNVSFDLDIGYFDEKGKFINSHTMKATSPLMKDGSLPQYKSHKKAKYAVETVPGFFKNVGNQLKSCRLLPLP